MEKANKTIDELKKRLSPEQYQITQCKGTEPAFTGEYWNTMEQGIYICRCCFKPLFSSEHKFISHCGWASFYQPINHHCITEQDDFSHNMYRIEIICQHCHAHLGHVFDDAPTMPTGLRYCINSASLIFKKNEH